jgi:hypothetical protein
MILHCTAKLAAKLPAVSITPLEETSPLGGWHGHLVTLERRQCVFFVHDATRYALFLPGLRKEHFAQIEGLHRELFLAALETQGLAPGQIARAALALGPLRCDRATDRSVLGSLRIAADDLFYTLPRWGEVMTTDTLAICKWLNQRPTTARGVFIWPVRAMAERVAGL